MAEMLTPTLVVTFPSESASRPNDTLADVVVMLYRRIFNHRKLLTRHIMSCLLINSIICNIICQYVRYYRMYLL